jgi:glycyl-tRNA synthetase beta chain
VAGLVEWPVAMLGTIDSDFMSVPERVLITSMRQHQKYFALLTKDGKLSNRFAVVANIEGNDGGKTIIAGNERVLRARLSDAKFFWEQDKIIKLEDRLPKLKDIVFHAKLGTIGQKTERMVKLAQDLAPAVKANAVAATEAAMLAKADLVCGMVGEFPELQGYMGGQYAAVQGEDAEVAAAIGDHYKPVGANDDVPTKPVSIAVALADKIDTLVAFYAIDEKPTGSKDPYALRRAALGVIRLVLENNINLKLKPILKNAYVILAGQLGNVPQAEGKVISELFEFFTDRLKVYLREKNVRHDVIAAVLALGDEDDLLRIVARAQAVEAFLSGADGQSLLAAYRRAANIIKIESGKDKKEYTGEVDSRLLQQEAEIKVSDTIVKISAPVKQAVASADFKDAMQKLAQLRASLDSFFESVMVNTDDAPVRANRLRLLNSIRATMDTIADFSKIEG